MWHCKWRTQVLLLWAWSSWKPSRLFFFILTATKLPFYYLNFFFPWIRALSVTPFWGKCILIMTLSLAQSLCECDMLLSISAFCLFLKKLHSRSKLVATVLTRLSQTVLTCCQTTLTAVQRQVWQWRDAFICRCSSMTARCLSVLRNFTLAFMWYFCGFMKTISLKTAFKGFSGCLHSAKAWGLQGSEVLNEICLSSWLFESQKRPALV